MLARQRLSTLIRRPVALLGALVLVTAACRRTQEPTGFGRAEHVAPGVEFYQTADQTLVNGAGPVAVFLLKIDLASARLMSALSNGEILHAETVDGIANRLGAIAAINGGYFNRNNGEPTGLLKVGGELVSDSGAMRGAVIIHRYPSGETELIFDQLAAKVTMKYRASGRDWSLPIAGVDTTRARGKLMLYTPAYHSDTDTAPTGTEWVLDGRPLRVVDVRTNFGRTQIPREGMVLSYGGTELPEELQALVEETRVTFDTTWTSAHGVGPDRFEEAADIVNGAGLLRRDGVPITEWSRERLSAETFTDARHPRTVIGVDSRKQVWLIAVDGRQPDYSIGMNFADLNRLCDRLELSDALNLDGGGSTTMVVKGRIVNRPSDPGGPRPVSDALVVLGPSTKGRTGGAAPQ